MAFISGNTANSRENSAASAEQVRERAKTQCERYLGLLRELGPLTDHEAAEFLGIPLGSVHARRHQCMDAGLVCDSGNSKVSGPFDRVCTLWGLGEPATVPCCSECGRKLPAVKH